jgi:nitrogen-specific signal transduction histidine kinase
VFGTKENIIGDKTFLQALMDSSKVCIWAVNTELRITYMNSAFDEKCFNLFRVNFKTGDHAVEMLPDGLKAFWQNKYAKALQNETIVFKDNLAVSPCTSVSANIAINPIVLNDKVTGLSVFCDCHTAPTKGAVQPGASDTTGESKNLLVNFKNTIAHEIRSPLNGIMGFSKLIASPRSKPERLQHYSKMINRCSSQLLDIIDDAFKMSISEPEQEKPDRSMFNLNDCLTDLYSVFYLQSNLKNVRLILNKGLPDNACNINTDKTKLIRILNNLIENALKHTFHGSVEFGYKTENRLLVFYVKDTGTGIAEKYHNLIFEKYKRAGNAFSNHTEGLGLGLGFAKENAEILGGRITVESEPGKGSCFIFTLPLDDRLIVNSQLLK